MTFTWRGLRPMPCWGYDFRASNREELFQNGLEALDRIYANTDPDFLAQVWLQLCFITYESVVGCLHHELGRWPPDSFEHIADAFDEQASAFWEASTRAT
jgi:hypothetical protein